jgi:hypothetical protein
VRLYSEEAGHIKQKKKQGQARITANQQREETNSKQGNKNIPVVYRES